MSDFSATPATTKRPTSLTVMGVLGIVFSGFAILGAFGGCAGAICSGTFMQKVLSQIPAEATGELAEGAASLLQTANQIMQLLMVYLFVVSAVSLVSGTIGLVGSIGLVSDKRWGRGLVLAYAALALVFNIASTVLYSIVIFPPYQKLMEQAARWTSSMSSNPFNNAGMAGFQMFGSILGGILGCAFPIILFIFLNTPKAKTHFAGLRRPAV
jgi:hypothetical protein